MFGTSKSIRAKTRSVLAMFWWLQAPKADEDAWQWERNLETLRRGESLAPGIGLAEEKEYIRKRILDYFGAFEGLRILGAGCGTGRIEAWLAAEGGRVVCMDHLSAAVEISRIHAQRMHCAEDFAIGDICRMPFRDGTFDFVNSGGVLEHFEDLKTALDEYFRVTKPNGVIIVSVPNLIGVNAMFGMKPLTELVYSSSNRSKGYIERNFSARGFRDIIQESGFRCLDISPTLFNTFDTFPFRYLRQLLSLLGIYRFCRKFLNAFGRKFPGIAFGYSFMIVLAQRPVG